MNTPIFLIFLLLSNAVYSWSITPMSQSLSADKKHFILKINNTGGSEMIAIKLSAFVREQSSDQLSDTLTKTKDIRIFPSQIIVPARQAKPIRIYIKKPNSQNFEKSYRLVAEALPIEKNNENSGVKVFLKYIASLYIEPLAKNKNINIVVNSAKLDTIDKNLVLKVSNPNNYHRTMNIESIVIINNDKETTINDIHGMGNVLAQSSTLLKIPLTDEQYNIVRHGKKVSFFNTCKKCDSSNTHLTKIY